MGRLTYELAYRGFYCEGNEFSLFMLIASNFVLNKCIVENQYTMYPWVHQFVNNLSRNDQVRPITFPDVSPTKAKPKGGFNMVAGDFLQVVEQQNIFVSSLNKSASYVITIFFHLNCRCTKQQIIGIVFQLVSSLIVLTISPNSLKLFSSKLTSTQSGCFVHPCEAFHRHLIVAFVWLCIASVVHTHTPCIANTKFTVI